MAQRRGESAALALVAMIFLAGCANPTRSDANEDQGDADLLVMVTDRELVPVENATVDVPDLGRKAYTSSTGEARLDSMPPGRFEVLVHHEGYENSTSTATIREGEDLTLVIRLTSLPSYPLVAHDYAASGTCSAPEIGGEDSQCGQSRRVRLPSKETLKPHLHNASLRISWQGDLASMSFRVYMRQDSERTQIPFADGQLFLQVEGSSPIEVKIPSSNISHGMRRAGNLLWVEARGPASASPPQMYSQTFRVEAHVVVAMPPEGLPAATVTSEVSNKTVRLSWPTPAQPAGFQFPMEPAPILYEATQTVLFDCPGGDPTGITVRFTDPNGRSVDVAFGGATFTKVCGAGSTFEVVGPTQFLWKAPGEWKVQPRGECPCSLRITITREDRSN